MRPTATLTALGVLLLAATAAVAQPDVGLRAPAPDRPLERFPRHETTARPATVDDSHRGVRYDPAFIGPTARGETTEFGFSGWIAPSTSTGSLQPGGDVSGWAALGFTFTWGGTPQRPSSESAVR